ncbi:HAD family hydrolase [candidate division WOR-3 bacterium]|uniref:HAD family hydrolase n=1 Tax=candidate division WOR-3 bacterium TaxID=2052148 RepID=A0A937XEX7_UNCW3|nr:HAD family hydrolase [candidate division WOR-3 bacterium]
MFKAVLFDLDDTLMPDESAANEALVATAGLAKQWHNVPPGDLKDSVRRVARRLFRAHPVVEPYGGSFDVSSWEALCSTFDGDDDEMRQLRQWAPEYHRQVWSEALAENGIADPLLADQLSVLYPCERRARYVPYPDVKPCLERLGTDYRLGLVTNGPCDLQCAKLDASGFRSYFGAVVISREVGVKKPDPRVFAIALDQLGVGAQESVFVGDSPKNDIVGAHAAGMRAIWLNRDKLPPPDIAKPDAAITGLDELSAALALLSVSA